MKYVRKSINLIFILYFVSILVIFEIIQRISYLFGKKYHRKSVYFLNLFLTNSLKLLSTSIEIKKETKDFKKKTYIIVSNHQSLFDIPIISVILKELDPKFIAKKELSRFIPSISFNLNHGGCLTIDRKKGRESIIKIIKYAKEINKKNESILIFPEGTRTKNGGLGKFHDAGFLTLIKNIDDVEVIPVAINGAYSLVKNGPLNLPHNTKIKVKVGTPIKKTNNNEEFKNQVFSEIKRLFESI